MAGPFGAFLLAWWRLGRPETWMVSLLPMIVGHVLASRELVPGLEVWTAFWHQAASSGATTGAFADAFGAWWRQADRFLLAAIVMGPLLWFPTLLWNDVQDLSGDRLNPRKARSPLVQEIVSSGQASTVAWGSAVAAVAVGAAVSTGFAVIVLACLFLAWAYSVPPLRLKTRPGADVAVNAIGVGLLAAMAGWTIAAPLRSFPWVFAPQGILVAVAVYVPTTLVDLEADRASGYQTLATHLGHRNAYRIGWWAWVAANLGALGLAWTGTIIPRAMFPLLVVFTPLLLVQYHMGIGRARDGPEAVKGIVQASFTFLAVNLVFAMMYTGLWVV